MAEPQYTYHIRDKNKIIVDDLDAWISLNGVLRFNRISNLELELARSMPGINLLDIGCGIIIKRDGTTIFSGNVLSREKNAHTIQYSLKSDERLLAQAVGRPNPESNTSPFQDDYYVMTSPYASSAMIDIVNKNIGPAAPAAWRIPGLVMGVDPLLGYEFTMRSNLDPIITLLKYAAASYQAGGLRFQVVQSDTVAGQIEFVVSQCRDRSEEAKFSVDQSTAIDYTDSFETGGPNYFYILGGDGFGHNRQIAEGGDFSAIQAAGEKIVEVVDARGTTSPAELQQKLAEQLATVSNSRRITISPQEIDSLVFGVDYDLGDIVTVIVDGEIFIEVVRDVQISFSPNEGPRVTPTVNGSGTSADDGSEEGLVAQHILSLRERMGNIERNFNIPDNSIINSMLNDTVKEWLGDVKASVRAADHGAWLRLNGRALDKAIYDDLYLFFVAEGLDFGSTLTTFNIPNGEDRYLLGAGTASVGDIGGSGTGTITLPAHNHGHSHGGGTLVYSHTHTTGSHVHTHSHGLAAHRHGYVIDHDHPQVDSSKTNIDSVAVGHASLGSGATDHHHTVNIPNYTSSNNTDAGTFVSGGAAFSTTEPDAAAPDGGSNTGGVNPGASWSGGSDSDSTGGGGGDYDVAIQPPYLAVNWFIYTGVLS